MLNLGSQHMTLMLPSWRTNHQGSLYVDEYPHTHGEQPKTNCAARKHASGSLVQHQPERRWAYHWEDWEDWEGRDGHYRKTGLSANDTN